MSNRVEIEREREQQGAVLWVPERRDSHIAKVAIRIFGYPGKLSSIAT